jgi:CheY-like chemotaxis protein
MARRPRVLFLDDDAQVRRFAELVLEHLDIELVLCASVAEGVRALAAGSFEVAICDLMLAGESGFGLIERIAADPACGATRVVVFSAAVDQADRQRMLRLGVWRELSKPATVAELTACVTQGLAGAAPLPPAGASADDQARRRPTPAAEQEAVAQFFEGDAALFQAYRVSCIAQFRHDLRDGDAACAALDIDRLRRLAHSLKTVLGSLGAGGLAAQFAVLERLACDGQAAQSLRCWRALRCALDDLSR